MSDHFIAGTIAGIGGLCIAYPLDTAKIRIQCNPSHYRNGFHCLYELYKTQGIISWYRGLLAPVLGYGAINSAVFGVYGATSNYLTNNVQRPLLLWETITAGATAGIVQSFVRAPVERIKTICQNSGDRGTIRCLIDLSKNEGLIQGLMRGIMATLYRETPQYMLYFPVYNGIKIALTPKNSENTPPWVSMIAGGTAGTVMWLPPIYSIDVIKSRIQASPSGTYKNVWDCTKRAYRSHGIRIFFDGLSIALLRAFPLHGSIFVIYEFTMQILTKKKKN